MLVLVQLTFLAARMGPRSYQTPHTYNCPWICPVLGTEAQLTTLFSCAHFTCPLVPVLSNLLAFLPPTYQVPLAFLWPDHHTCFLGKNELLYSDIPDSEQACSFPPDHVHLNYIPHTPPLMCYCVICPAAAGVWACEDSPSAGPLVLLYVIASSQESQKRFIHWHCLPHKLHFPQRQERGRVRTK